MKVIYIERIRHKTALDRNKFCTCGEHGYDLVEQLEPKTEQKWSIRCPYCGRETCQTIYKEDAMFMWKYWSEIYEV